MPGILAQGPHHPALVAYGGVETMTGFQGKGQRFVALCMLGLLLFNYPILALFNVTGTVLGVPVLYAYIFIAWAALIGLMAFVAESNNR